MSTMNGEKTPLDSLLYALELCEEHLPFDMAPTHIIRLEEIKARLRSEEEARGTGASKERPRLSLVVSPDRENT